MKSRIFRQLVLVAAGALLLPTGAAFAAEESPMKSGGMAEQYQHFDWIEHTQHTLDELKVKLNLAPEQMAAWNAWSGGVLKDARQQLEQKKSVHEKSGKQAKPMADETTPEQMAEGIARLRDETNWMQEHLTQLEGAQVRTAAFYNTLGANQKTIFDLFWHEMHHRVSGHDGGWGMRGNDGGRACPMMEQH